VSRTKTILVVVAHADDLEFMAGGTVARFVVEKGYRVFEYILTDNSKGSYQLSPPALIEASAREAVEAGKVLGIEEVRLEGYADAELETVPSAVLRGKIMAVIREVKADIVMSWDPFAPYEDHPDHRAVAMATLEAAAFSANPLFYPDHGHPPHVVTEAYWFAKHPWNAECFVDIGATIDRKIEALLKHSTQMALTVDSLLREGETLGVDLPVLRDAARDGYRTIIDMGIRQFCAAAGAKAGVSYAEQFRYEKLGMLDSLLGTQFVQPDFQ